MLSPWVIFLAFVSELKEGGYELKRVVLVWHVSRGACLSRLEKLEAPG